jgi:predicted alpha/beta-fold hydrolase
MYLPVPDEGFSPQLFRPLPLLASGWAQTIGAVCWPRLADLRPTAWHTVPLPDGDQLIVAENRPRPWRPGDRIVVLVHGLAGSSASKDLVRLCRKLVRSGYLVMRVNLRGCGPGFGLARHLYHSGRSEDLREVNRWVGAAFPDSPVTQIGFSLGGNITLKLAGEDGATPPGRLDSLVAVSAPIDLAAAARRLAQPENRFFDRYFARLLVRHVARQRQRFPDLPGVRFPADMTLRQFDDLCTAPWSGFRDADDYYARASSERLIPHISCPALVLCAADDPIVDAQCYRRLPPSRNVRLVLTTHGGHVGFLARPGKPWRGVRWMDDVILNWVRRLPPS